MSYLKESKLYYIEKMSEMLAHEIYLYEKYYSENNENILDLYRSATDQIPLNRKEVKHIITRAKDILFARYGIKVVSDNPVMIAKI